MSQILLINDMPGYGKVATAAMLPILSYYGISVYNLPTALVSNPFEYGKFNIMETTDYIEGVFPIWKELGFKFDAIAVGFIVSKRQADLVKDYCKEQSSHGTTIYFDPIMGDEGKLYNGIEESRIEVMKEMISVADLVYPNYTEAAYLTGHQYREEGCSEEEAVEMLDGLLEIGSKSALITSMRIEGKDCVIGYNHKDKERFVLTFDYVDAHFPGTGDTFSAVLIAHLQKGDNLKVSTQHAMNAVRQMVLISKSKQDKNCGLNIEKCLYLL